MAKDFLGKGVILTGLCSEGSPVERELRQDFLWNAWFVYLREGALAAKGLLPELRKMDQELAGPLVERIENDLKLK